MSARDTQRHRLFVRNATQLVSMLVNPECKIRCGPGAEMEEQVCVVLCVVCGPLLATLPFNACIPSQSATPNDMI